MLAKVGMNLRVKPETYRIVGEIADKININKGQVLDMAVAHFHKHFNHNMETISGRQHNHDTSTET